MGILLAGETVEKVSGMRLRDFEQTGILGRLGVQSGAVDRKPGWGISATVWCWESPGTYPEDIEWFSDNTEY